jgi:serine/threonine-protein kinase HipA
MNRRSDRLSVDISGMTVGTLGRSEEKQRDSVFSYGAVVAAENAVSLTMPVRPESYYSAYGIHPLFEMHIPEGYLKDHLVRRFSKAVGGFDGLALLGIVGPHQLGRVGIARSVDSESPPRINVSELLAHNGAQDLFADLMQTCAPYSGVSGVQPKVLVRDLGSTGLELESAVQIGATHLVKAFNESDFPQLAANEFSACGQPCTAVLRCRSFSWVSRASY